MVLLCILAISLQYSMLLRSILLLYFIVSISAWNIPLVSVIFLNRSLVFPILLFSSIYLHWPHKKPFLSLLAVLWNSAFIWIYLSFSAMLFASPLFLSYFQGLLRHHFAFLHFFLLGMVLIFASSTMSKTSVHSSSDTLSDLIPWICCHFFCNHKGFDLGHTWLV